MIRSGLWVGLALVILGAGCGEPAPEVVVYTALDEFYSKPILEGFEADTGIKVRVRYDTEASKTTGLTARLNAERDRPRCDVFWNNEIAQTILLQNNDVLEPYESPQADGIPAAFQDDEHFWIGFAARARVVIYNTDLTDSPPRTVEAFTDKKWRGKLAIAKPLFGTTVTHVAALYSNWGAERTESFLQSLLDNDVAILAGNATVRDRVAAGEFVAGLTDTDDANGAVEDGRPVKWFFPDQAADAMGTLVIPNTVALIKNAPNPDAGRQLIDYLLRPETESALAASRSIQIPLNPAAETVENTPRLDEIRAMDVDWDAVAGKMPEAVAFVNETMIR